MHVAILLELPRVWNRSPPTTPPQAAGPWPFRDTAAAPAASIDVVACGGLWLLAEAEEDPAALPPPPLPPPEEACFPRPLRPSLSPLPRPIRFIFQSSAPTSRLLFVCWGHGHGDQSERFTHLLTKVQECHEPATHEVPSALQR